MTNAKFNQIIEALNRNAKVIVGLNTYNGSSAIDSFKDKYAENLQSLHYAQTRIFEKGVKYVVRARFGN